ncbi:multicopper oxidase family protein [Marininema halotolerans]|uniref:Spore coat protein A n=1 Tax=Marininema halotolerans TaxID=1155944 RepID=A0A1I6R987_9BACL|nr:multicopper oxidase domain-containing protein [Marininema halotolerans]SFS61279.1 spore coat protein A [Marininema halotolerans]
MKMKKFVNPLPVPPLIKPFNKTKSLTSYKVTMREGRHKFDKSLPPAIIWGYNGIYPGPTFEVRKNERVEVHWINQLPRDQFLPVDTTILPPEQQKVPTGISIVHLHGGKTRPEFDGYPTAWYSRDLEFVGPEFVTDVFQYDNNQRPTGLMYHDHTFAITRLNVYAGLFGTYFIRGKEEDKLNLPKGKFELPINIHDLSLNPDGTLFYPDQPDPNPSGIVPSVVPEFFGEFMSVNGKLYPFLDVEPRKYRFRIVNICNSRFLSMRLTSGQPFIQIGTDGGLLKKPVKVEQLILGPAERADVILDFSQFKGKSITLTNNANSPFPDGDPVNNNTSVIMQFRVTLPLSRKDKSEIPNQLSKFKFFKESEAVRIRDITLDETLDQFGRLLLLLNNTPFDKKPITETPELNTIEIWRFINLTEDTHPMHIHLVQFQILYRQKFDVELFEGTGELEFTSGRIPPDPNERGFKDTVRANPDEVTAVIARFGPFSGLYVYHCHILEHEDYEMMRPFEVVDEDEE